DHERSLPGRRGGWRRVRATHARLPARLARDGADDRPAGGRRGRRDAGRRGPADPPADRRARPRRGRRGPPPPPRRPPPPPGPPSLDTDYVHARNPDGSDGALIVPLTGGLGVAYQVPDYHGDLGIAAVRVVQDVPDAAADMSRVFATSSGYWRFGAPVDAYHFAVLDVAGTGGVHLTNGSVGLDARPVAGVQLSLALHHVSTD